MVWPGDASIAVTCRSRDQASGVPSTSPSTTRATYHATLTPRRNDVRLLGTMMFSCWMNDISVGKRMGRMKLIEGPVAMVFATGPFTKPICKAAGLIPAARTNPYGVHEPRPVEGYGSLCDGVS